MAEQSHEDKQEKSTEGKARDRRKRPAEDSPTSRQKRARKAASRTPIVIDGRASLNSFRTFPEPLSSVPESVVTSIGDIAHNTIITRDNDTFTVHNTRRFDHGLQHRLRTHEGAINRLKSQINDLTQDLLSRDEESQEQQEQIQTLQRTIDELYEKTRLSHLIDRVSASAQQQLLDNPYAITGWNLDVCFINPLPVHRRVGLKPDLQNPR